MGKPKDQTKSKRAVRRGAREVLKRGSVCGYHTRNIKCVQYFQENHHKSVGKARKQKPSRFKTFWNDLLDRLSKDRLRAYRVALIENTAVARTKCGNIDKTENQRVKRKQAWQNAWTLTKISDFGRETRPKRDPNHISQRLIAQGRNSNSYQSI